MKNMVLMSQDQVVSGITLQCPSIPKDLENGVRMPNSFSRSKKLESAAHTPETSAATRIQSRWTRATSRRYKIPTLRPRPTRRPWVNLPIKMLEMLIFSSQATTRGWMLKMWKPYLKWLLSLSSRERWTAAELGRAMKTTQAWRKTPSPVKWMMQVHMSKSSLKG